MTTITEITKLGNAEQRKALKTLRDAKRRTATANKTICSDSFLNYDRLDAEHAYMIQELASKNYEKALESFTSLLGLSDDEAIAIANKIRV